MGTTPVYNIPYPEDVDKNDVPRDLLTMATQLDSLMDAVDADHAGTAWGVLDYTVNTTSSQVFTQSYVDITDGSVTWTAVAGRRYRIQGLFPIDTETSLVTTNWVAITDNSNVVLSEAHHPGLSYLQGQGSFFISYLELGSLSGSTTRKFRCRYIPHPSANTGIVIDAQATRPQSVLVEDIGPI